MRTAFFGLFAFILSAFALGCGSADSKNYDFTENGCDTQPHSFNSQTAYCAGLESNTLNNGCALDLREQTFARDCSGAFVSTN